MSGACKQFYQVNIQNSRYHEYLKFKLKRESLSQIYISFLRPVLEYASVVWNNCIEKDKEYLEKIQLKAARIVSGLTRSASLTNIYIERNWWLSLDNRRKYQKLIFVYKVTNIISCFPVGYRKISVKIFFDLTLVLPVKIPIFMFLLPRLICACLTTRWKYDVIYLTFLVLDVVL